MKTITEIIEGRDRIREREAARLASIALSALQEAGFRAWLIGSLARGEFRSHSDIDLLIDVDGVERDRALLVSLQALKGHSSSIVFKSDVPDDVLPFLMREASGEPRLRSH